MIQPRYPVLLFLVASLFASDATGQVTPAAPDLFRATLEDLMKIQITSASRKEQPIVEVPAAVFVLTQDDIRRSGMRTIPELLRLVPGVQVGRINSSNWAVSIRGFNDQFANKLLVLVDGRSIYQRVFSGVFWDAEDMVMEDIERIEVIRGPGAAVWGANAVNGVINIVT
jgi:iron complex outermembrane receptor protein